jgi:hypothetical protein
LLRPALARNGAAPTRDTKRLLYLFQQIIHLDRTSWDEPGRRQDVFGVGDLLQEDAAAGPGQPFCAAVAVAASFDRCAVWEHRD